jgi:hypothetical protein
MDPRMKRQRPDGLERQAGSTTAAMVARVEVCARFAIC